MIRAILVAVLLLAWSGFAAAPLDAQGQSDRPDGGASSDVVGYPLFRNYTPDDYGRRLLSQNWSVTQDEQGIIYVANPDGVLVYDAEQWRVIPTERETFVRQVMTDTAGTVYVGAYGEIGRLEPDSTGTLQYVSLLDHVDPELRDFGHTWDGVATDAGAFFLSRHTLFHWNGTSMRHWQASDSTRFGRVFSVHDSTYVYEVDAGLKKLRGDSLALVADGERFADEGVYTVLPYNNGLLVGTSTGRLYRQVNGQFEPLETEARAFLAENELYDGVQLPDGTYAFATLRGGVLITNRQGEPLRVLDKEAGLVDDDVKSLFVDRQGGLWLACESGLARVDVLSPLSLYDERSGLEGVAISLARHNGRIYAGTSAGIYGLSGEEEAGGRVRPRFQQVDGLRAQVFELVSTSAGLLAATEKGVYAVENGRLRRVGTGRAAVGLHASRYDSTVAYVGYIDGIGMLRRVNNRWTATDALQGFNKEIYFLEEDAEGMLWAASAYGGLWRVEITGGLDEDPPVQQLASEEETPRHVFRMTYLDDQLHVITRDGLAEAVTDETGRVALEPDSSLYRALPDDHPPILDVAVAPDGDLWVFTEEVVYWLQRQSEGSYAVSTPLDEQELDFGVQSWMAEANGIFWLAGEEGVLRHAPRPLRSSKAPIHTLIRRVATVETDSLIFGGTLPADASRRTLEDNTRKGRRQAVLAYDHNALRFEFAAPGFGSEGAIEYQYRLIGFSDEWSSWTEEAKKDYTNLPPGTYEFQVRARNPRAWEARVASFRFEVLPPWYRTLWAYVLFAAFGVALVAGAVWWRSAHLETRARRLEQMVAQRTQEVQEQAKQLASYNRELRQTNEVLQEALEQKSELLGMAAHDLKNPLFGIRGLSEILLENQGLDESMHRKIQLIYESADETLELINDLLESAAASSGQVRLDMETIDVEPLAEWVVHSFRPQAEKKGQQIHFQAADDDFHVEADERKLREAMSNLVSNAVKYSPKGARIDVEVIRADSEVTFLVQDEGPGLSESERKNLFAPFQRLSPEPTAGEASSGLGLYIVKQLVELHDGHVWVESEVGEGSTFGITLPAAWASSERNPQTAQMESR